MKGARCLAGAAASVYRHAFQEVRGIAQPGSAAVLGTAGRWFESSCPDHLNEWHPISSELVPDLAEADPQESRQHDENAHCFQARQEIPRSKTNSLVKHRFVVWFGGTEKFPNDTGAAVVNYRLRGFRNVRGRGALALAGSP